MSQYLVLPYVPPGQPLPIFISRTEFLELIISDLVRVWTASDTILQDIIILSSSSTSNATTNSLSNFLKNYLCLASKWRNKGYFFNLPSFDLEKEGIIALLVFRIIGRYLTILDSKQEPDEIFNAPTFLCFCQLYGARNPSSSIQDMSATIVSKHPSLINELQTAIDFSILNFKEFSDPWDYDPSGNLPLSHISDLIMSWTSCVLVAGINITNLILQSHEFFSSVINCYDRISQWISHTLHESPDALFVEAKKLKRDILTLLFHILQKSFLEPVGISTIFKPGLWLTEPMDSIQYSEELIDDFLSFLSNFIETGPAFDESTKFLVNASILVDFEIEFDLSGIVKEIQRIIAIDKEVDQRFPYIIACLENSLSTSEYNKKLKIKRASKVNALKSPSKTLSNNTQDIPNESMIIKPNDTESTISSEAFITRTSLISEVQDLLPHLGEGFIDACLDFYKNDVSKVIMCILEDSIPESLKSLPRTMPRKMDVAQNISQVQANLLDIAEQNNSSTKEYSLSDRANVFDGDEFDVFTHGYVDPDKYHIGKKERGNILEDKSFVQRHKESLLRNSFDQYDDEYDDTYDSYDISYGALDDEGLLEDISTSLSHLQVSNGKNSRSKEQNPGSNVEEVLVSALNIDPNQFEHSARKSEARVKLKNLTNMTDEQIEGWYRMFKENSNRQRNLQQYEWKGEQPTITPLSQSWKTEQDEEDEDEENPRSKKNKTNDFLSSSRSSFTSNLNTINRGNGNRGSKCRGGSNRNHGLSNKGGRDTTESGQSQGDGNQKKSIIRDRAYKEKHKSDRRLRGHDSKKGLS